MKYSREFTIKLDSGNKVSSLTELLKKFNLVKEPKKEKKRNVVLDITITLPRKKAKRRVTVFSNFVKVGWDQYSIKHDHYTGYEYVIIEGERYEVVRDVCGQGYLVEV